MSDDSARGSSGATTAGGGTPMAVDVSGEPEGRRTLALFVSGPVIWTAHFLLVYLVTEAGCTGSGPGVAAMAPPVPTIVTLAATVVAVAACLTTGWWSYRRWRRALGQPTGSDRAEDTDHGGTLALCGAMLAGLGVVTVLFVGLPALVLPAC